MSNVLQENEIFEAKKRVAGNRLMRRTVMNSLRNLADPRRPDLVRECPLESWRQECENAWSKYEYEVLAFPDPITPADHDSFMAYCAKEIRVMMAAAWNEWTSLVARGMTGRIEIPEGYCLMVMLDTGTVAWKVVHPWRDGVWFNSWQAGEVMDPLKLLVHVFIERKQIWAYAQEDNNE